MEFGNRWRPDKGQFFVGWEESEARQAHESGRPYSVFCQGADNLLSRMQEEFGSLAGKLTKHHRKHGGLSWMHQRTRVRKA